MILYILITIATVFLAGGVSKADEAEYMTNSGLGCGIRGSMPRRRIMNMVILCLIFLVLFLTSALRYKVGNDYTRYEEFFHLIPLKQVVPTEAGFNATVLAMQFIFGGEAARPIFAVYAFVTVAFMLKAIYDQSENFFTSFALFMAFSYYFQSMNTVRYYLAWAVALYSMKYVLQKNYLKFIPLILITGTIHKSVLLVIPAYLLASANLKRIHYILLAVMAGGAYLLRGRLLGIIMRLYPSYEGTAYLSAGTSLINIIRMLGVIVLMAYAYRQINNDGIKRRFGPKIMFYARLNYFALLLYVFGSFIPEISRVGYYLSAGHIFLIPELISCLEDNRTLTVVRVMLFAALTVYFGAFLYLARQPLVRIVPYHTWIFSS